MLIDSMSCARLVDLTDTDYTNKYTYIYIVLYIYNVSW